MDKRVFENGGVTRFVQAGPWSFDRGLPDLIEGRAISQSGWASCDTLSRSAFGIRGTSIPQMWLCGGQDELSPIVQRFYLGAETPARLIKRGEYSVGYLYEDDDAEYTLLSGVLPKDFTLSREEQTRSAFEETEAALESVGMDFSHVARTWLYMDRILDWYDAFNRARDSFFLSRHVYDGLVPASTGIGSANQYGSAIVISAIAVKPKRPGRVCVKAVDSPLQCTAQAYGSSFSRAVEIRNPSYRTVLISGTASIEPGGATAFVGDTRKQIGLTLDVVEAILKSREMGWEDATRGLIYLKHPEYLDLWRETAAARKLDNVPILPIVADVCRDNLLVEVELDAVKKI